MKNRSEIYVALVDDDNATNYLNQIILKQSGILRSPNVFINGRSCLDFIQEKINGKDDLPDLIFLDLNMPGMDGWEFINEYEKMFEHYPNKYPILIILSTSQNPADLKRAAESSLVSHYLVKPLEKEKIFECFDRYF